MGIAEAGIGIMLCLLVLILFLHGRISAMEDKFSQLAETNCAAFKRFHTIDVNLENIRQEIQAPREYILTRKGESDEF